MVQTTIVRTPDAFARQASPRRELRRPPFPGGDLRGSHGHGRERGPAMGLEERGSLAGTLLLIALTLAVISWVMLAAV